MKRILRMVVVSIIGVFIISPALSAQEWSAEQQEVLSTIEGYSETQVTRDIDGFLSYFHEDYKGWSLDTPVPYGKESIQKWVNFGFPRTELMIYEIKPLEIMVFGESAIAHYYFYYRFKNYEGKENSYTARWTDFLVKVDGKWLLTADHGGRID